MRVGHKNKTNQPIDNKQRNKTAHTEIWGRLMWCRSQGEAMLGSTYLLGIVTPNLPEVIRPRFLKKRGCQRGDTAVSQTLVSTGNRALCGVFSCHVHSLMCFILHRFTWIYWCNSLVFIVAQTLLCFLCTLSCFRLHRLTTVYYCKTLLCLLLHRPTCVFPAAHSRCSLLYWLLCRSRFFCCISPPVSIGSLSYTILWISLLTVNLGSITGLPWWRNSFEQTNMTAK